MKSRELVLNDNKNKKLFLPETMQKKKLLLVGLFGGIVPGCLLVDGKDTNPLVCVNRTYELVNPNKYFHLRRDSGSSFYFNII